MDFTFTLTSRDIGENNEGILTRQWDRFFFNLWRLWSLLDQTGDPLLMLWKLWFLLDQTRAPLLMGNLFTEGRQKR